MVSNLLVSRLKLLAVFVAVLYICARVISIYTAQTQDGDLSQQEELRDPYEKPVKDPEFIPTNLDVIHLVSICHSADAIFKSITFMKSVLYYRTSPIHFHILTNLVGSSTVRTLFYEWDLPFFNYSVYVREDTEPEIAWIPYIHGPGRFAFKKLLLDHILPEDVDRVILYDVDMILQADITELWNIFDQFNSTQAFGIGYETQVWYNVHSRSWPAIGYGFNSGMMLCDLAKLRAMKWNELWLEDAKKELAVRKYAPLAEQDLLNVYFLKNPEILFVVPCTWNMQFGERVDPESCPYTSFKALHTTHKKLDITPIEKIPSLDDYRQTLSFFMEMDGSRFSKHSDKAHRVMPHVFGFDFMRDAGTRDVTLALHLTYGEMSALREIMATWVGSISVAVLISDKEALKLSQLPMRPNIKYHFVYRGAWDLKIPHQLLRTVAVKYVESTHVIVTDTRFRLRGPTCQNLRDLLDNGTYYAAIPTFMGNIDASWTPHSKKRLAQQLSNNELTTLQEIHPSIYERWLAEDNSFVTKWSSKFRFHVMMPKKSYPVSNDENAKFEDFDVTVPPCCMALKLPGAVERKTTYRHQFF